MACVWRQDRIGTPLTTGRQGPQPFCWRVLPSSWRRRMVLDPDGQGEAPQPATWAWPSQPGPLIFFSYLSPSIYFAQGGSAHTHMPDSFLLSVWSSLLPNRPFSRSINHSSLPAIVSLLTHLIIIIIYIYITLMTIL